MTDHTLLIGGARIARHHTLRDAMLDARARMAPFDTTEIHSLSSIDRPVVRRLTEAAAPHKFMWRRVRYSGKRPGPAAGQVAPA